MRLSEVSNIYVAFKNKQSRKRTLMHSRTLHSQ